MTSDRLDDVDRGILYLLQQNARNNTTEAIGEQVGVSSSTVANRIKRLENSDVITGYHPTVDYQKAGLEHHILAIASVPFEAQEAVVDEIMGVTGVVSVRELLSNRQNVAIELVGDSRDDIEQALTDLTELDVDVERNEIMKRERLQPFDHFGQQIADEGDG